MEVQNGNRLFQSRLSGFFYYGKFMRPKMMMQLRSLGFNPGYRDFFIMALRKKMEADFFCFVRYSFNPGYRDFFIMAGSLFMRVLTGSFGKKFQSRLSGFFYYGKEERMSGINLANVSIPVIGIFLLWLQRQH